MRTCISTLVNLPVDGFPVNKRDLNVIEQREVEKQNHKTNI